MPSLKNHETVASNAVRELLFVKFVLNENDVAWGLDMYGDAINHNQHPHDDYM